MSILYKNDRPQHLFGRRNRKSLFAAIVPLLSGKEQKNQGTLWDWICATCEGRPLGALCHFNVLTR